MTTRTKRLTVTGARGALAIGRLPQSQQPHLALKARTSKHARQKRPKSDADAVFDLKQARMQDSECWDKGGER